MAWHLKREHTTVTDLDQLRATGHANQVTEMARRRGWPTSNHADRLHEIAAAARQVREQPTPATEQPTKPARSRHGSTSKPLIGLHTTRESRSHPA
jgi:hypothetical protein